MELRLYDTLTKEKRPLVPLDPKNVRMYVCGPTVYDFAHIGNARPVIVFDVLFRLLRHIYGDKHVTYVRNITDVDDKINDRASRDFPGLPINDAIRRVTELTERQFHDDVDALGALRPTVEPRATEHIDEMRTIINKLVDGGFAYVAKDHVLFSPQAMNAANEGLPRYGSLANRSLDEMIAGARVDVAPYKRDSTDFVLWKPSKPGEPSWPSPSEIATPGRPGWHIECSAMAWKHLGEQFDIHGGGIDLVFPHHENELAQSCCAFHANRMANVWMHNGFVQVEGEKMSKSLGNFRTISDVRGDWQGEVIRYQMLMSHYRQPLDWTESISREAQIIVDRWYQFFREFKSVATTSQVDPGVLAPLLDDLNTPEALMRLTGLFDRAKKNLSDAELFVGTARFMGFFNQTAEDYFSFYEEAGGVVPKSSPLILGELKAVRDKARAQKDFDKSDYLRNIIYLYGSRVIDGPGEKSELVSAQGDFFSITAGTRAKLSSAVRHAMSAAASSNKTDARPSLESGFASKFGRIFNYTREFNSALRDSFEALEVELKSGAIAEEDLRSAIVDVVLSNLAEPAKFGPDVVAGAALLKLFGGMVKNYEAFFDNVIIAVPEEAKWKLGGVEISGGSTLFEALTPEVRAKFAEVLSPERIPDLVFRVRIESSSSAIKYRALTMVRAFVTATRFLMYTFNERAELTLPSVGGLEASVDESSGTRMRLAISDDGGILLPGHLRSIPYRLSERFIEHARTHPLYDRLSRILSLSLYSSTTRELLALDQLCRARSSDDPYSRFRWNMDAISSFCGTDDLQEKNVRGLIEFRLSRYLQPKEEKLLLKRADRFDRLRQRPSFIGKSEAQESQVLAEDIVLALLDRDPRYVC